MEVKIAYTLSPRWVLYLDKSIRSLRLAWINNHIDVFAEPWKYCFDWNNIFGHRDDITLHRNEKKLWCFKNYNHVVNEMIKDWYDWYVMILQDDFIFEPDLSNKILDFVQNYSSDDLWYLCLWTPFSYPDINKYWWNESRLWWWSRLALYFMHARTMREMIQHPFYINHLENYKENKQVDACVSETLLQMWKKMFFHNPSLATHIWETSSVWHDDPYVNMKYHKIIL